MITLTAFLLACAAAFVALVAEAAGQPTKRTTPTNASAAVWMLGLRICLTFAPEACHREHPGARRPAIQPANSRMLFGVAQLRNPTSRFGLTPWTFSILPGLHDRSALSPAPVGAF